MIYMFQTLKMFLFFWHILQPAGKEGSPGGCASRVDVVVGQTDGGGCQGVNVGRHKRRGRIGEPNVCITLVVSQAANNIGFKIRPKFWFCFALEEAYMNIIFGGLAKTMGRRRRANLGII